MDACNARLWQFLFYGWIMAQYDGSIRINTKIDVKSAEAQIGSLEVSISKTAEKIAGLRSKMDALKVAQIPTQEYSNATKEVEKLQKSLEDAYTRKERFLETGGDESSRTFKVMEYDIEKLEIKLRQAEDDVKSLVDSGKAFTIGDPVQEEKLTQQIASEEARLTSLASKRDNLNSKIQAAIEEENRLASIKENATVSDQRLIDLLEQRRQLLTQIKDLERAGVTEGYAEYDNALADLSDVQGQINGIRGMRDEAAQARESYVSFGESVKQTFKKIAHGIVNIPISALKKGAQGLLTIFSKLGSVVKKSVIFPFRMMGNVAKSAFSSINKHANKSGGALSKFGGRIKEIVLSFFLFNQIRKIFTSTVNSIKEGFTNLYNDNLKFKASVDNLKASLLTMKNALASAFAPIVETAIPYIQRLVEWVTKAADAVGQLFSALMGRKTYTKAIKQSAVASEEAAEATEDETKAIKKQLSPLDDLNNLTSENAEEKAKDSGTGTGAGMMFEEVPISDKFKNIAKWLKDMWANSDFYKLGKLLGEKLKSALDNIPWSKIKKTAHKIGKSIATLINGFVEVEGLGYSIGKTLIEAINTGFEFLNAFVHNLHWESVGKFIADTINGFFENIDWELIYDTFVTGAKGLGDAINSFVENLNWDSLANSVSSFVNTFVDTINTFFDTVDWLEIGRKIGKSLSDAISNIDWKDFGKMLSTKIRVAIEFFVGLIESMDMTELAKAASDIVIGFSDSIAETIENIDWWAIGEKAKEFLVNIDWAGVFESLCEAIGAAFGGLAAFLGGLIAEGVVSAGEFFQGKIEECGGNVVLGILKGIGDALYDIGVWIKEHIFQPFIDGFKKAFEINSPSKVMEEMGKNIIDGLLGGLKEKWEDVVKWLDEKASWIAEKAKNMGSSFARSPLLSGKSPLLYGRSYPTAQEAYAAHPAIAKLSNIEIPQLATGAVLPANREFLALVGDQKHGTNVEAPLDTIKQALREEAISLGLIGRNETPDINLNLTVECAGYQLLNIMQKLDSEYFKQTGRHALT